MWNRDCFLGPAGKERPHLAMTGESHGISRAAARPVLFLSSYDGELREPLLCPQGISVSIRIARGSTALLLSHGMGLRPQDALKGESRGILELCQETLDSLYL